MSFYDNHKEMIDRIDKILSTMNTAFYTKGTNKERILESFRYQLEFKNKPLTEKQKALVDKYEKWSKEGKNWDLKKRGDS